MGLWKFSAGTLPWTKSCFVCGETNPHGFRLRSRIEGDRIVLNYTTREADLGYRHLVHGGISMTLLDEAMTWAAILSLERACVAAELTVRLRQPVSVNQALRVEGWTKMAKSRLALSEGHVLDAEGRVLATAEGKYVPMPSSEHQLCLKDFVASPDAVALPFLT